MMNRHTVHHWSIAASVAVTLAGCGAESDVGSAASGAVDDGVLPVGTYVMTVAADEPRPGCINGAVHIELDVDSESVTRFRVIGGRRGAGQQFSYSVFRDQITLRGPNHTVSGRWAFDGEQLTINDLDTDRCADDSDWSAAPFVLTDGQEQSTP